MEAYLMGNLVQLFFIISFIFLLTKYNSNIELRNWPGNGNVQFSFLYQTKSPGSFL